MAHHVSLIRRETNANHTFQHNQMQVLPHLIAAQTLVLVSSGPWIITSCARHKPAKSDSTICSAYTWEIIFILSSYFSQLLGEVGFTFQTVQLYKEATNLYVYASIPWSNLT